MKKIIALSIAAVFLTGMCASAITVNVSVISGYQSGSGGEFNVSPVVGSGYAASTLVSGGFETFCFDRNPALVLPGTFNATVNTTGQDVFGLQMVAGVAWLYQQFAIGALSGYDYVNTAGGTASGRAGSAYNLQLAIWNLEGQYGGAAGTLLINPFVSAAVTHFGLAGAIAASNGSAFNVGILNLNNAAGAPVQPVLTLLPTLVPDGGSALLLLGMSLSGLALISRKLRS